MLRPALSLFTVLLVCVGCVSHAPPPQPRNKFLKIGTGSRIDILRDFDRFTASHMPPGWVLEGAENHEVFQPKNRIPSVYMTMRDGRQGVHILEGEKSFVLARYTSAHLLVSPYLSWNWYVSEHKDPRHPVRLIVGLQGGNPNASSPPVNNLIWRGNGLPPYDRLIAIGFDDTALKRGNLFPMGEIAYYAQRGGQEQANRWHTEASDLSLIYRTVWPQDDMKNVKITFVGFMSDVSQHGGGMTFTDIWLSR